METVNAVLLMSKINSFINTIISLQCLFYINISCPFLRNFPNDFTTSTLFSCLPFTSIIFLIFRACLDVAKLLWFHPFPWWLNSAFCGIRQDGERNTQRDQNCGSLFSLHRWCHFPFLLLIPPHFPFLLLIFSSSSSSFLLLLFFSSPHFPFLLLLLLFFSSPHFPFLLLLLLLFLIPPLFSFLPPPPPQFSSSSFLPHSSFFPPPPLFHFSSFSLPPPPPPPLPHSSSFFLPSSSSSSVFLLIIFPPPLPHSS